MKKKILKIVGFTLTLPILYIVVSLILGAIPVNLSKDKLDSKEIYLSTNGVHLDIVIPIEYITSNLKKDLIINDDTQYLSFGWGDENFYINTPNWSDLTFSTGVKALFFKSPTLMHVTQYMYSEDDWVNVSVSNQQLESINRYLNESFLKTEENKIILRNKGYTLRDDFYKAKGNYHLFNTCNSWVNNGFKYSGLKACFWTPYDFQLLNLYQ